MLKGKYLFLNTRNIKLLDVPVIKLKNTFYVTIHYTKYKQFHFMLIAISKSLLLASEEYMIF